MAQLLYIDIVVSPALEFASSTVCILQAERTHIAVAGCHHLTSDLAYRAVVQPAADSLQQHRPFSAEQIISCSLRLPCEVRTPWRRPAADTENLESYSLYCSVNVTVFWRLQRSSPCCVSATALDACGRERPMRYSGSSALHVQLRVARSVAERMYLLQRHGAAADDQRLQICARLQQHQKSARVDQPGAAKNMRYMQRRQQNEYTTACLGWTTCCSETQRDGPVLEWLWEAVP